MGCAMDHAYLSGDKNSVSETNVIELNFSFLQKDSQIATGEPFLCQGCNSILNSFSLISHEQNSVWSCEFCGCDNVLSLEPEELPTNPELTYILEPSVSTPTMTRSDSNIVFCIDISGSMAVTKAVSGKIDLRLHSDNRLLSLLQPGEENQFYPGFDRNVTYISRLDCVKMAISAQIQELLLNSPEQKVGIVAFCNEVVVVGDGTRQEVIAGDRLNDFEELVGYCEARSEWFITKPVKETAELLKARLMQLDENGPTALGPALLVSLLIAEKGGVGSKVVICTDGLANIGVGSLEGVNSSEFYKNLGSRAVAKGVSVSIISIEGDECRLEALMNVTEASGGDLMRVAPEKLLENFKDILSNKIVATQVQIDITLHKALRFKNEPAEFLSLGGSRLVKKVGNATEQSSFSFGFNLKTDHELEELCIDKNSMQVIPMQATFTYRTLDGTKCIRVFNKRQPVTFNKEEALKNANFDMLARAGRRQAASLAEQGRYEDVRMCAIEWKNEINKQKANFNAGLQELEEDLAELQDEVLEQEDVERRILGEEEVKQPKRHELHQDKFVSKMNRMKKKN